VAQVLDRFVQSVTGAVETFLSERQERGEVASHVDAMAAARAFLGALLVHFLMTSIVPHSTDAETDRKLVDTLVATLVHGLASTDRA
jgi:hypothetical protein